MIPRGQSSPLGAQCCFRAQAKLSVTEMIGLVLIMDAHLGALAIEHGATLCTNDRDFSRFTGLKVEFPIQ